MITRLICAGTCVVALLSCEKSQTTRPDKPETPPAPSTEVDASTAHEHSPADDRLPRLAEGARDQIGLARQIIVVTTPNWSAHEGSLTLYERRKDERKSGQRTDARWKPSLGPFPATVGHNGLGWGRGLTLPPDRSKHPTKEEGDGKAPAGLFELGDVFGYSPTTPPGVERTYHGLTDRTFCVDDPDSPHYNRILVWPEAKPKTWTSAEAMRRGDELYSLLITVEHNGLGEPTAPVKPGAGSCIFVHVWGGPGQPTIGCTSMARADLAKLLARLEPADGVLLAQFPQAPYAQVSAAWGLPTIN